MDPVNQPGHVFDGLDLYRMKQAQKAVAPDPDYGGKSAYDPTAKPSSVQGSGRAIQANQHGVSGNFPNQTPVALRVVTYDENLHEVLRCIARHASFSWDANPYAPCNALDAANLALKGHQVYYDSPNDIHRFTRDPHLAGMSHHAGTSVVFLNNQGQPTMYPDTMTTDDYVEGLAPDNVKATAPACSCRAYHAAFKKHAERCPLYGGT